ncbi:hypothetical protein [Acinetobacter pittii]|uniref:Uncharacterized protein n=1 Tax=Acinetobacter pittii TaxID=48296 RepID=A0A6H0FPG6_ACIPI|nr:hypothetical protein [Acinetobacter pittii]AUM25926.1 hypothetical protein BVD86_02950 [Acinetobacter pittii]MBN6535967.1 hypothetical protein [Acinetobacter pittii]OCY38096.1 hypothetical protein BFR77_15260 [Acinetobacter pittii]QIT16233.1 hypothetical protein G8E09_07625 [Acinetobacter pittii]
MAQDDLDDLRVKIKKIWLRTIFGIIFFLIVSFFLKSSYPITHHKFNLTEAYEVLKDSLTIAAAFLAPVAAFVLFSDWRLQHRAIAKENNSSNIFSLINRLSIELNILNILITQSPTSHASLLDDILEKIEKCELKNSELIIEFNDFSHKVTTNNGFTDLCDEIITSNFPDFLLNAAIHYALLVKLAHPESYATAEGPNFSVDDFVSRCKDELEENLIVKDHNLRQINENLGRLSALKEELNV